VDAGGATPRIRVDRFEARSGIAARLEKLGADVHRSTLQIGDYELGAQTVVERKSVGDLHASVVSGRFWGQIGRLRRGCRYRFLLVEGTNLDIGPLRPNAVRGICLAAQRQGVRLLRSLDNDDSALWLFLLARQCQRTETRRDRPAVAQRPQPRHPAEASEAMLAAVPGLSTVSARALLVRFGTVAGVLAASPEDWMAVKGIGRARAQSLARALDARFAPGS
jgi:ERCC4-type nuclease